MKPFFSIIVPTYNRAHLIAKAIESVINQTLSSWELIIVDDGSTDNTKEIVNSYNDSRIRYIYQQNAERSEARNNGIKNSTGTYICFLDSDDYYLANRLKELHNEIIKQGKPIAFYYTGILYLYEGEISARPELSNTFAKIQDFIVCAVIGTPQVCIHESILAKENFNPLFNIGEDMELWLRVSKIASPIYLENQFTVVAVEHDTRSVNVKLYNSYIDQMRMLRHIFSENHPGHRISENIKKQLRSNCFFGMAKFFIYNRKKRTAARHLMQSIFADVSHFQNKYRLNILLKLMQHNGIEKAILLLQ